MPNETPSSPPSSADLDRLFQTVYREIKNAAHRLRGKAQFDAGLQTTQLVHELYLRLRKTSTMQFPSKPQFFAYAARAMRSIIIDQARSLQSAQNREQAVQDLKSLAHANGDDQLLQAAQSLSPDFAIALERALLALAEIDARASQVVELHFFLELPLAEIAEQLGVTVRTIDRDWRFARAFLRSEMSA